jgi:hypothetical protein
MNSFLLQKNLIKSQSTRDFYRGNLKPISNKDYQFTKTKNYSWRYKNNKYRNNKKTKL